MLTHPVARPGASPSTSQKTGHKWSHGLQPRSLTWLLKMLPFRELGFSGEPEPPYSLDTPTINLSLLPILIYFLFACLVSLCIRYLNWSLVTAWETAATRKLRRGTWVFSELWWAKRAFSGKTQLCCSSDSCWWADDPRADPWDTGLHPAANTCPRGLHPPEQHHQAHSWGSLGNLSWKNTIC